MKLKSLTTLFISGLFAASLSYTPFALADDTNTYNQDQSAQPSNPNSNAMGSNMSAPSSTNNTDGSNANSNSMDQGSPDTATGDDDY